MTLVRALLIGAFSLLLVLPGLQVKLEFIPEEPLAGVNLEAKQPSLTLTGWWSGDLQSEVEAWFGERIGFRGHAVRTDNQIGLSVFHEASSRATDTPVLGRRMMVYEDHYVTAYDGGDRFRDRGLRKLAREMGELQDSLSRRGIAFVLIISPSKVATYPEYLPAGYVHPVGERPPSAYERMLPMLRREGVHVVDGHTILEEEKARSPRPLFPPGGIHWNRYAAFLVLHRAWEALEPQLGRSLVGVRCGAIPEDDEPLLADQETDVADLLNVWHVGHDGWRFPRPELYADNEEQGFRPKLIVVGDSFWFLPDDIIATNRVTARYDFFYYFNEFPRVGGAKERKVPHPVGVYRGMTWDYVLSADAIVIEVNEVSIGQAGYGFVQQAQKALRQASAHARHPAP
jgi:alginate O-acetyltransferase complex protein AlgJ